MDVPYLITSTAGVLSIGAMGCKKAASCVPAWRRSAMVCVAMEEDNCDG